MKLITQSLILASLPTVAMADYAGLSFELVHIDGDQYTIRMYAEFDSTEDQLNGVFGDAEDSLYIHSDKGFYQNPFGGPTSVTINPALFAVFPSLEYDSWVTIGSENYIDNQMNDIGISWDNFEAGGSLETDNGIWFTPPDEIQAFAGSDLRVMVAQFTTLGYGNIYGEINLIGKTYDGETFYARNQYFSMFIPSPPSIALIGLFGLRARRRQ